MAHSRSIHRSIDQDLLERIIANGSQAGRREAAKKLVREGKEPRSGRTYRGARRNARRNKVHAQPTSRDGFIEYGAGGGNG